MTDLFSKIKEITEIPAISGHEAPVRDYLRAQLTPHVDEVVTDGLGGIFGVKHSQAADAPRVLVAAHMDEVGFMVSEIKPNGTGKEASLRLIDGVITQLARLRPDVKVIVSSFSHLLLHLFKQRAPEVPVGCLYERRALSDDWRSTLEIVGADYIHPEDSGLTRQQVQEFRAAGYGVNIWTVNSPSRADELFSWGATGVFSDVAHQIPGC